MRKLFAFFAAMLVVCAVNATETSLSPGSKVLYNAVAAASAGDVLVLDDGVYEESEVVLLNKNITIKAAPGAHPVIAQNYYMKLMSSAQVTMQGLKFDGGLYKNNTGATDHCIRPYDNSADKSLTLIDCEFYNWSKGYVLYPQRADRCMKSLTIRNCYFHNNARSAVYIETGSSSPCPLAELYVENTTIAGAYTSYRAIDFKNGGTEVADAKMRIDHCTFYNCGPVRSEKSTDVIISNSIFAAPEGATYAATTLYAGAAINNCLSFNVAFDTVSTKTACVVADPLFRDAANGDLRINAGSPVFGAATDGSDLGDPRWLPHMNYYLVGSMTNWGLNADYQLTKNMENDAEYMISLTLLAGDEFKIVKSDGETVADENWYPTGMGNNYTVTASGDYTVYFRPDGQGGDDWHYGFIYASKKDIAPWETWFGDANWQAETNSYLSYNELSGKATVYIRDNKDAQWKAQVKYHGVPAENDKCYRVALKMKANRDLGGVTLKWQDDNNDPNVIYENQTISLAENEIYTYEQVVAGIAGNGILVLDFGYAQAGDIIEIFDVVIEETECPEPVETVYYLVGTMTEWGAEEAYKFEANPEVEGEYMLNTMLAEGAAIKAVAVTGEEVVWYPEGWGNDYIVDAAHAGWTTVYFRPAGNEEWAEFGGYIYIDVHEGIDNVDAILPTVKTLENGQLIIIKNGVRYNAIGAQIR